MMMMSEGSPSLVRLFHLVLNIKCSVRLLSFSRFHAASSKCLNTMAVQDFPGNKSPVTMKIFCS